MAEHVDTIGAELKQQREMRGISLKEIADATKIGKRFLEAIEQDDWKTLPAPVFTRGFIRAYAKYVGVDVEFLVDRYSSMVEAERLAESGELPAAPEPVAPRYVASEAKSSEIPRPYRRIDRNIILLVVILVPFIAVGYWVKQRMSGRSPASEAAVVTTEAAPASAPAPAAPAPVAAKTYEGLEMTIRAVETTWLVILVDGRPYFSDEMRAGDIKTLNATDRIEFRTIGNAGGVSITLNGRDLPPLGESGRVIHEKVYTRDSVNMTTP